MKISAGDLERVFNQCFLETHQTMLVGGGAEPPYLPSSTPSRRPHRVIYREDYLASALHEVAHWCLAGIERRKLEDYGYWYSPDGRSREEQSAFENVEARPQALEWILSDTCEFVFQLSADNLTLGVESSDRFESEVETQRKLLLAKGLPARAALYRDQLTRLLGARKHPPHPPRSCRASPAKHRP